MEGKETTGWLRLEMSDECDVMMNMVKSRPHNLPKSILLTGGYHQPKK